MGQCTEFNRDCWTCLSLAILSFFMKCLWKSSIASMAEWFVSKAYNKLILKILIDELCFNRLFSLSLQLVHYQVLPLSANVDTSPRVHLFSARGPRWKRLRAIANPIFNTNNLKKVYSLNVLNFLFYSLLNVYLTAFLCQCCLLRYLCFKIFLTVNDSALRMTELISKQLSFTDNDDIGFNIHP